MKMSEITPGRRVFHAEPIGVAAMPPGMDRTRPHSNTDCYSKSTKLLYPWTMLIDRSSAAW